MLEAQRHLLALDLVLLTGFGTVPLKYIPTVDAAGIMAYISLCSSHWIWYCPFKVHL